MDYEKMYKETLERAKIWQEHLNEAGDKDFADELNYIFPELKESRGEKIRKMIINQMERWHKAALENNAVQDIKDSADAITWLEKQGEQNPIDKVGPKFHEGDWLCENELNNYARFIQILEIINIQGKERYRISRDIRNNEDIVEFGFLEKYYHKFDIKDAKDGDVLTTPNYIYIFNSIDKETETVAYYCLMKKTDKHFSFGDSEIHNESLNSIPATKEQRDLLFQKMKEAGYEWNIEKKKLEIVDLGKHIKYEPNAPSITKENTSWSEEDERIYKSITYSFAHNYPLTVQQQEFIKSFKDRYTWKPTDGQIKALKEACGKSWEPDGLDPLYMLYQDLKKLKGE